MVEFFCSSFVPPGAPLRVAYVEQVPLWYHSRWYKNLSLPYVLTTSFVYWNLEWYSAGSESPPDGSLNDMEDDNFRRWPPLASHSSGGPPASTLLSSHSSSCHGCFGLHFPLLLCFLYAHNRQQLNPLSQQTFRSHDKAVQ